MNYILKILLTAVAVLVIAYLLPGVDVDDYGTAIWVAFIVGILFSILKPLLVILTLPVTILTLGLFLFVINAAMFGVEIVSGLAAGSAALQADALDPRRAGGGGEEGLNGEGGHAARSQHHGATVHHHAE